MRSIKQMRNERGLSPIFAVLILIAITVIAAIIVYLFTSGYLATMMGGGSAGQEKVAIQTVTSAVGTASVYAKSVGGGPVTITDAIIKDSAGITLKTVDVTDVTLAADGTMGTIAVNDASLTAGNTFTITLISKSGNQFVSSSFKVP